MPYEFKTTRRVEFSETDMAGIMHFSNFFRYMENTEHEFLRSLGLSVCVQSSGRIITWPRVEAGCRYLRPLRFEDRVEIQLRVREKKKKSITYDFCFTRISNDGERETAARGTLAAVCVSFDGDSGRLTPIPIPEHIDRLIEVAPAQPPP